MAYGPSEDAMMDFFQKPAGGDSPKGAIDCGLDFAYGRFLQAMIHKR